jgi:peptidoglycan/LPS O-acetylase OafA/YrhL
MKNETGKAVYFPGLNGIRALAALAVVVSHITLSLDGDFHLKAFFFGINKSGTPKGYRMADYGVSMFFALSGFLITYLLQMESDKQEINVPKFYLRRMLRIWPLYYLYLILCTLTFLFFGMDVNFKTLFYFIFFAANIPVIFQFALPLVAHLWSIGVEEQFYLFWPWVVKKVKSNIVPWMIGFIVLQDVIRFLLWHYYPYSNAANFALINRFDSMLLGAVGAVLYKQKHPLFLKMVDTKWMQAFAFIILGLMIANKFQFNASVGDNFMASLITVILIVGQINKKNRLISLENPVLDFLGKISFGIYMYHPLLIFIFSKIYAPITGNSVFKYILIYSSVLGTSIGIAYLSYAYFESWFIRLKSRFTVVRSIPHKGT